MDANRGKPDVKYQFATQMCHMVGGLEFFLLVLEMVASFVVHFYAADMTSFLPTNAQKHVCSISTHLQTPPDADLPQRSVRTRFACSDARVHRCMSCYVMAIRNVFLRGP